MEDMENAFEEMDETEAPLQRLMAASLIKLHHVHRNPPAGEEDTSRHGHMKPSVSGALLIKRLL